MSESTAKIMYLRVRELDVRPRRNVGQTTSVKYKEWTGREPTVTIAHTLEQAEDGKRFARVGYALYHYDPYTDDRFNRKIGRNIAVGRMQNTKSFLTVPYPETAVTWSQRMSVLMTALRRHTRTFGDVEVQSRLGKAVDYYLSNTDTSFDTVPTPRVNA